MTGLTLTIDTRSRVALIVWPDEEPRLQAWLAEFERVLSHPQFEPDFGIVSDRRALTMTPRADFVRAFIESVAASASAGRFRGRWATVVAPSELAVYGMGRMTELLGDQHRLVYRVFTEIDEALRWASGARA